jgi:hypothetical protein
MTADRLSDLEANLTMLYEQLAGQERAKICVEDSQKIRIQQQIEATWQEIRRFDREYVLTFAQQMKIKDLPEPIAETVTAELVDEIEVLAPLVQQDGVKALLLEILAELQRPDLPVAAKLKVVIPIIPTIVSYELEGDTESVLRRLFPSLVKLYRGLRPKK